MNRFVAAAIQFPLWVLMSWSACASGSPWAQPIGRRTGDRDADLIDALVRENRFDDAQRICQSQLRGIDGESDASSKWRIRQSQILTARQMVSEQFEDADVQTAQKPTADLLASYPHHRRRLFLEAQNVAVVRHAAVHGVVRAAVSPADAGATQVAFKRLLRATADVVSLSKRVGDARSQLDSQRAASEFALVADLIRLQQVLQVDAVSMALMQTELFPRGSDDCLAAATKAEQAATDAIARLPADSVARREVERLKVEAIFRSGQTGRAEMELGELIRSLPQPLPPPVQAMQIRVDLASERRQEAERRLAAFYGDTPQHAPHSIEMDLARLDYLMQSGSAGPVGAWLDAIERRGGAYARRRAEAISLSLLRTRSGDSTHHQMVDPSLVAAQGQDWLRRGNPGRAGELLSAAAAAEPDPDRAIRHASEAAAALVSADRTLDAARVLADVSLAKSSGANAAAAHLQAAVLVSRGQSPESADRVEELLRANLQQWPSSEPASDARKWLLKLLSSQRRHVEAAEVATQIPADRITVADVEHAVALWRIGFRSSDGEHLATTARRFQDSFRRLLVRDDLKPHYVSAAALLIDRSSLAGLPKLAGGTGNEFIDALLEFRRLVTVSEPLRSAPADLVVDATWRLMRDGRTSLHLRESIAEQIGQWVDPSTVSFDQAERLLWIGQVDQSIQILRRLAAQSPDSAETMKQAATLLSLTDHRESQDAAIQFWDQLAAGAPQGSRTWHEAKIAAIRLLAQTGKKQQSRRRAKYILLTMPSIEATWRQQYEAESQ